MIDLINEIPKNYVQQNLMKVFKIQIQYRKADGTTNVLCPGNVDEAHAHQLIVCNGCFKSFKNQVIVIPLAIVIVILITMAQMLMIMK